MENLNKMPLVSIVSVNYNTAKITIETIKSLQKISYPNFEIIIVDNASVENPDVIKKECPEIRLIRLDKNLGFAGGNNIGIKESKGDYVMLLNSDTEVEIGFLEPLVELLVSNPQIGAVSPKIVYYYSENKSLIQYAGCDSINMLTGRGFVIGNKAIDNGDFDKVMETQLPHGAAVLLPKKVISKVGLMPEIYFLYYEEHDWAELIKRNGYKIFYNGNSKIYHKESMSVGRNNPMKVYYLNRNRIIFMRRNSGLFTFIISFLFYSFISIPKNVLSFLLKGKFEMVAKLMHGYFWNFAHWNVKDNPFLSDKNEIVYSKIK